ncbi:MAG: hypothetical protein CVU89_12730 [Firmicutes bacterium HGW-Firmicutes-14]|nr:MAG: hypothetical protein CVU89_12730 [Firmicutes bacterium HGW-Firmicutes-14]
MNFRKKPFVFTVLLTMVLGLLTPHPVLFAASSPVITVSSPADNAVVTVNLVNVSGYVSDTSVLKINGVGVPFSTNGFFSYTVRDLLEGSNTIIISATGSTGAVTNKYLTVNYDPEAVSPVITVTGPADNSEVYTDSQNVTGTVSYNDTLSVLVNGTEAYTGTVTGAFSVPVQLAEGDNTIVVTATGSGLTATKTIRVRYTAPAVITGVGLDDGVTYRYVNDYIAVTLSPVTLDGYADGAGSVTVTNNGQQVSTIFDGSYFYAALNLTSGANNILITAQKSGISQTREILIYYGPEGPQLYNVQPADGSTVYSASVTVRGMTRDANSVTVNGYSASIASDGSFSRTVSLAAQQWNTVTVVAANSGGNSVTRSYSIFCRTDPVITVNEPEDGKTVYSGTVTVSGKVINVKSGGLTVNGSSTGFNSSTGSFSTVVTLKPGNNTIVVKGTNSAGVTVEKGVTVEYAGGPAIYSLSPVSGSSVTTGTVTVTGNVANTSSGGLKINDSVVSFDSRGNFAKSVSLQPGSNTITVKVTDGFTTTTKTIIVTYLANPIITLTSPVNGDIVIQDSVVVTGKVFNTETKGLTVNGEYVSFSSSDGSFSKTVELSGLENEIEVTAYNGDLWTTREVVVYYQGIPSITVSSHSNGDIVETANIILEGWVFPTDPAQITTFTIDGTDNKARISEGRFRSYPVTLEPGDNSIEFILTTASYNTPLGRTIPSRTITRTITITHNEGPSITVTSPLNGSTVYANNVTIKGTLKRADFNSLEIGDDAVRVSGDGRFQHTVNLQKGENEIELSASLGDTTTVAVLTLYYNPVAREGAVVRTEVEDTSEVRAFEDMIKVKIAKGSVGLETVSVLSVADPSDLDDPPDQSAFVGPVFRLRWDGDEPLKPYRVTLKYDDVVRENQAHKVSVFWFDDDEDEWQVLGGAVDAKSRTVTIETDSTGYFTAMVYFRTFDDVNYHWAQRDIEFLVARGAVSGHTGNRFMPDSNVTRAEFVTFLVKALGIQPYEPDHPSYRDVGRRHWGYKYIEAAFRAGIISGISHDRFGPDRNITREEAAALLARAGNLKVLKDQEILKIYSSFTDADKISFWARKEVASAIKSKVLNGSGDGTFSPHNNTTRGQAAAMIARLTEAVSKTGTSR